MELISSPTWWVVISHIVSEVVHTIFSNHQPGRGKGAQITILQCELEVFSEDIPRAVLWYKCGTKWA